MHQSEGRAQVIRDQLGVWPHVEGTCEQCTGCTTSHRDPSSSLASAFAGEKHRKGKRNWLEERQRKVSVAPCPRGGGGGKVGEGSSVEVAQSGSSM